MTPGSLIDKFICWLARPQIARAILAEREERTEEMRVECERHIKALVILNSNVEQRMVICAQKAFDNGYSAGENAGWNSASEAVRDLIEERGDSGPIEEDYETIRRHYH